MEGHQRMSSRLPHLMLVSGVVDAWSGISITMTIGKLRDGVATFAVLKVAKARVVAVELNEMMFHITSLPALKPRRIAPGHN